MNKKAIQKPWHTRDRVKTVDQLDAVREARMAYHWQTHGNTEAREALVDIFGYLCKRMAYIYRGYTGFSQDDLIAEGYVALVDAIDKFDPECGRFAPYANLKIRSAIQEYVMQNWSVVKVWGGDKQRVAFFNISKLKHELGITDNFTRETAEKAAQILRERFKKAYTMTADDLLFFEQLKSRDFSLNTPLSEDDGNSSEHIDSLSSDELTAEEALIENEPDPMLKDLALALDELSPRARDIITRHKLAEEDMKLTLKELAEHYKVSVERVRQLEQNALRQVCKFLDIPFKADLEKEARKKAKQAKSVKKSANT
jgi:RNA polymerase sigma-32 factor